MLEKIGRMACVIFLLMIMGLGCDAIISQKDEVLSVVRYYDGKQEWSYGSFSISIDEYVRLWKKRLGKNTENSREGQEKFYPRWINTIDV